MNRDALRRWLVVSVACLSWPIAALGGGVRDLDDAWLVPPGAVRLLLRPEQPGAGWLVTAGHGALYGMPELAQMGLAVEKRTRVVRVELDWQQLGSGLYREQAWRASAGLGRRASVGVRLGLARLDLEGDLVRAQSAVDLWWQAPLGQGAWVQGWLPLGPAPVWYGQQGLRRWLLVGGQGDGWAWVLAVDRAVAGRPSLQGEVLVRLTSVAAIGLRGEPATGSVGLSTVWRAAGVLLRSSHLVHPDLGITHRWGIVAGGGR